MGMTSMLAFTVRDHWRPGIGDPTFLGWLTTVAYFAAALLCGVAARSARANRLPGERMFWLAFVAFMTALGINKQLDLQTWFTLFGKHLAQQEGWYMERRLVQAVFILLITLAGLALTILLWKLARRTVREYRLALLGGIFLGCFIVVRAASFHHVDQMLGWRFGYVRLNHCLELGGILLVALAALRSWRRDRKHLGPAGPQQFVWGWPRRRA